MAKAKEEVKSAILSEKTEEEVIDVEAEAVPEDAKSVVISKKQVPMPVADVSPNMLLQMAVQGNADVDKLEKLMELQERHERNEARKAYVVAMSNFRSKCPTITKDQLVSFDTSKGNTSYHHAGLSGTIEQIKDIMTECGLSHSWRTSQHDGQIKVTCILSHIMGHSEETSLECGADTSGGKNTIQALGSTQTYLERYTLFAILGLASAEDNDGAGIEASPGCNFDEVEDIKCGLAELGSTDDDEKRFLKKIGASSISEMTKAQYEEGMKLIEAKKEYLEEQMEKEAKK